MSSRTLSRREVREVVKNRLEKKTNLRSKELTSCTDYIVNNFEKRSVVTFNEVISVFEEKFERLLNNLGLIRR